MKQPQRGDAEHRGVSFGTVFMCCVTVVVVGLSAAILPRLLGKADFRVDGGEAIAALTLDGSMPALTLSDIPITELATVLGYADAHYFSGLFKQKCGMSPRTYRNQK